MYLTFRIGGASLFAITDWAIVRSTHRGSERLLYKPSWRTVFRRLIVSLICSAMLVVLVMTFGLPPSAARRTALAGSEAGATATKQDWSAGSAEYLQELRRTMPADKWAEMEQRVDQLRAQREEQQELQDRRYRMATLIGKTLFWIAFGLLALVALLAPAPWQRVIVASEPGREQGLRVTKMLFWPRTRVCPAGSIASVSIVVREWWHKGRFKPTFLGWLWEVRIHGVDPRTGRSFTLEFWPDLQPDPPDAQLELTPRIREFVDTIALVTGVQHSLPIVRPSHCGK